MSELQGPEIVHVQSLLWLTGADGTIENRANSNISSTSAFPAMLYLFLKV